MDRIEELKEFIETEYKIKLLENIRKGKTSLITDFNVLSKFNPDIANELLESPDEVIQEIEFAIKELVGQEIRFRIRNLPQSSYIPIWKIRSEHVNKFVQIEGHIRKLSKLFSMIYSARFECPRCGELRTIIQGDPDFFVKPKKCTCKYEGNFKLISKIMKDTKKIVIEDDPKRFEKPTQRPARIVIILKEDLCMPDIDELLQPSIKVIINGIIRETPTKRGSREYKWYVDTNYIGFIQEAISTIKLTELEIKEIKKIAKSPVLIQDMTHSIFPFIEGNKSIKQSIFLSLIGSPHLYIDNVLEERGNVHILLIGSPGSGKSKILKRVILFMPGARYTGGRGASGAGLVAAVIKDAEWGFSLEFGAVAMCHGSLCCVDEIDKIYKQDLAYMNPAMSELVVPIDKANISADVLTDTIILAAGNPKYKLFDPNERIWRQLGLPKDFLDRFDLIFVMEEQSTDSGRRKIADIIIDKYRKKKIQVPKFSIDFIIRYIAHARTYNPEIDSEVEEYIKENFIKFMRPSSNLEDQGQISYRLISNIIRLTKAVARARLSNKVILDDSKLAMEILIESFRSQGIIRLDGLPDYERLECIIPKSKIDKMQKLREIMIKLEEQFKRELRIEEILVEAAKLNIQDYEFDQLIQRLKESGDLFEPRPGWIKLIR